MYAHPTTFGYLLICISSGVFASAHPVDEIVDNNDYCLDLSMYRLILYQ